MRRRLPKTIYYFNERGLSPRASEIALKMGVSPPSATAMLRKLEKKGYLIYVPYKGLTLTRHGLSLAEAVVRKYRLLERFLTNIPGINTERIHEQACDLEHSLSDETEELLRKLLDHLDISRQERTAPTCSKEVLRC